MKLKLIAMSLLSLCGIARAAELPIDRNRLIDAIATVENTPRLGLHGERGPFQFTRAVWRQHTAQPFACAYGTSTAERKEQRRVALAHIDWITKSIDHATVYRIALAWNAGVTAVNHIEFGKASVDYAKRVVNVYEEGL